MSNYQELYKRAQDLASSTDGFLDIKGPGAGNHATNKFISALGKSANEQFKEDFSEKNICGSNSLAVDL